MAASDVLHDRVDAQEDLRIRARTVAERVVRERLQEAIGIAGSDMSSVLEVISAWVGEELADLTTEAVRSGAEFAARRVAS